MAPQGLQYAQNVREQFSSTTKGFGWPKKFFTFSFVLFASVLGVYLGLAFGYKTFLNSSNEKAKGELGSLSSKISPEQKEDLATLYSQVTNIRGLLENHTLTSQAFTFFESITSQKVKYTSFSLSTSDREVSIEGVAATYSDLVSQLVLFEDSQYIEKFSMDEAEYESGSIRFKMDVVLAKSILEPITL